MTVRHPLDPSEAGSALAAFEPRFLPLDGRRHAAVVVAVLDDGHGKPVVPLTRRPTRLRSHPGQFALPGGRLDDGETPDVAALRELHEELGLRADPGGILGRLDDYITRSGYVISPYVVWVDAAIGDLVPNPDEVAALYAVTESELDSEPRFVTIPESDKPVIQWPFRGHLVHAPTAAVVYQFREVVLHRRSTRIDDLEQPVFAWR
ncbi:CoA pyrophosphatase [Rhodococcus sp. GXMU-t2271]|uniref:CoA pyrophosphatase n=1 Tax=Rhodococcus indonesiensis TaxID=3055869 RepID=A0ABT7RRN5_9NOCA|nr:CoA pyrophosphatase [Rhodococcus indonesiensis]MDM7490312.1 CoA pyrophosphatase [Rhodococcus indonesiensis]